MITRKEYMTKPEGRTPWHKANVAERMQYRREDRARHREYYGQFVTDGFIKSVAGQIGRARLLTSTDEHLNDIPLRAWDHVYIGHHILRQIGEANGTGCYSPSDCVCVAKEAARQFIEQHTQEDQP